MKKFFVALVLCMMMVSMERPLLAGDYDYAGFRVEERSWLTKTIAWLKGEKVDKPPFAPEDLAWIEENGSIFPIKFIKYNDAGDAGAGYEYSDDLFLIPDSFYKKSLGVQEAQLHHETQHMKDAKKLLDAGYNITDLMHGYLNPVSQGILQGILETRAYAEQIVWLYKRKEYYERAKSSENYSESAAKEINELYEKYKEAYEHFVKDEARNSSFSFYKVFDDAVKSGESVEEARHLMERAFLNSNIFRDHYLTEWVRDKKLRTNDLTSLSVREILDALLGDDNKNDKWLTEEDIYAAYDFWRNLCSYEKTKDSDECRAAKRRYQYKYCEGGDVNSKQSFCSKWNNFISRYIKVPNSMNENFDVDLVFRKMDKVFEADKACTSETCKDKERILTTEKDENAYRVGKYEYKICCTLDWDFKDLK